MDDTLSEGSSQGVAEQVVAAMMTKDAFSQWLGIEVVAVQPGIVTVRMRVRPEMVNGLGVTHGGVVYSLADTALAFASNSHGAIAVSVDNSITYPAPIETGDRLMAVAERETGSARLAYYRVVVRNQKDAIVALFRGTVYQTAKPHSR